ncbi:MAG TPA: SMI1/KNR4 family protein [Gemmatimonadaceae bacterium]|nr:SMI1/KNR4 family protein [Gemmatimonadaceae bacterium]
MTRNEPCLQEGPLTDAAWRRQLAEHGARLPFAEPADASTLDEAERTLGLALPIELRQLLEQCNGVTDRSGAAVIWSAAELAPRNAQFRGNPEFRQLYMPFDALFFFGEAGNGDQFFYRILAGEVREFDIYLWDHETDSRQWRASRLEAFLADVLRVADEP